MHASRRRGGRAALSVLELQVAFVVFGVALAGLFPLVVMQSRQLRKAESRFSPGTTYYLVPSAGAWARKLGAAATLTTQDPGAPAPPPVLLIDNADGGYSESGTGWVDETGAGAYQGADRAHPAGVGANAATWQFTGLAPGWYDVRATWAAGAGRAGNASYTVYDGPINRGAYLANQALPPVGDTYQGQPWQSLAVVAARGTALRVVLSDQATGSVAADAVRLVPVRNAVGVLSLNRSPTADQVTAHVTVTVATPQ